MKFLVSAGEASSDLYGAQLIVALRRRARADDEPMEFFGVGGERMRAAGCEIVVEAKHLAVVGMTEILSHLPRIYSEFHKLLRYVDSLPKKPDAAIVIDSPAFNFRVARELHRRGVPVIYFVAPQLWAWREYRVRRVQKWIKKVLCIFPFEVDFYRKYGVDVEYVGHPLADLPPPSVSREEYARKFSLDAAKQWIALLPGSRVKEVKATMLTMAGAAALLSEQNPVLQFILPVAPSLGAGYMNRLMSDCFEQDQHRPVLVEDARAALHHSRGAVVSSGTATVEAALMVTPFVTVYRLSPLTFFAARRLVKVPHVAMPNLIAGRQVVPELLQDDFTPDRVATELQRILEEAPARQQVISDLAEVREKLKFLGRSHLQGATTIERAADAVMKAIGIPH
jgi:lipid-A-disaccharide synthase